MNLIDLYKCIKQISLNIIKVRNIARKVIRKSMRLLFSDGQTMENRAKKKTDKRK